MDKKTSLATCHWNWFPPIGRVAFFFTLREVRTSRDQCENIKQTQAASDNRVRMSSSVTEAAAIDCLAEGPSAAGRRRLVVDDHHHHRPHLQRQAQPEGRVALAGVPSAVAPETGLHRPLVRRCADRPQVGDHRRALMLRILKWKFTSANCSICPSVRYGRRWSANGNWTQEDADPHACPSRK